MRRHKEVWMTRRKFMLQSLLLAATLLFLAVSFELCAMRALAAGENGSRERPISVSSGADLQNQINLFVFFGHHSLCVSLSDDITSTNAEGYQILVGRKDHPLDLVIYGNGHSITQKENRDMRLYSSASGNRLDQDEPVIFVTEGSSLEMNQVSVCGRGTESYRASCIGKSGIFSRAHNGILNFGRQIILRDVTIRNCRHGISMQKGSVYLQNCLLTGNNGDGIYISPESSAIVAGSTIEKNAPGDYIEISNTTEAEGVPEASHNYVAISNWGTLRMYAYGGRRCRIADNARDGICLQSASSDTQISDTDFVGNGYLDEAQLNRIRTNCGSFGFSSKVAIAGGSGILAMGASVSVSGCTFVSNGDCGIHSKSPMTVTGCTFRDNGKSDGQSFSGGGIRLNSQRGTGSIVSSRIEGCGLIGVEAMSPLTMKDTIVTDSLLDVVVRNGITEFVSGKIGGTGRKPCYVGVTSCGGCFRMTGGFVEGCIINGLGSCRQGESARGILRISGGIIRENKTGIYLESDAASIGENGSSERAGRLYLSGTAQVIASSDQRGIYPEPGALIYMDAPPDQGMHADISLGDDDAECRIGRPLVRLSRGDAFQVGAYHPSAGIWRNAGETQSGITSCFRLTDGQIARLPEGDFPGIVRLLPQAAGGGPESDLVLSAYLPADYDTAVREDGVGSRIDVSSESFFWMEPFTARTDQTPVLFFTREMPDDFLHSNPSHLIGSFAGWVEQADDASRTSSLKTARQTVVSARPLRYTAVWDAPPSVSASDAVFTVEEITDLSDEQLQKEVLKRSGAKGTDPENKVVQLTIPGLFSSDLLPKEGETLEVSSVDTILQGKDPAGNEGRCNIRVVVLSGKAVQAQEKNTSAGSYIRFVDWDNYRQTDDADGGLMKRSKWIINRNLRNMLEETLSLQKSAKDSDL